MSNVTNIMIPDIGDFKSVEVVEILVQAGQSVQKEDPLITLESEKATMDVPAPCSGTVVEVCTAVGDEVSEGSLILLIEKAESQHDSNINASQRKAEPESVSATNTKEDTPPTKIQELNEVSASQQWREPKTVSLAQEKASPDTKGSLNLNQDRDSHASPAIRRFGRELGVNLKMIEGSGRKGRILRPDIEKFVKEQLTTVSEKTYAANTSFPELQSLDFSQWGPVEIEPLSRIQKRSGPRLLHSWTTIPHVTNHDEADITNLEAFRQAYKKETGEKSGHITLLPFILKAVSSALTSFPKVNSSLAPNQTDLILKRYVNIGVAVDTTKGLIVPVIRNVDKKGVHQLAIELGDTSKQAREGKLKAEKLQGGCFTISSLGGIGGRSFTPIINPPEVAILGVSRAKTLPEWNGTEFEPRLMLPLDLSYDHRVIDGASAARFLIFLKTNLEDIRRLLL